MDLQEEKRYTTGGASQVQGQLVAKGFAQMDGIDYNEIFSHVVRQTSIRIIISLVMELHWELEQMDVITAFLHGQLEQIISMKQLERYETTKEKKVCLLKKSLYGLKQSPRPLE